MIYGAGGIGGCLAAFLAQGGKDVSLIARGAHLEAIQKNGLVLETGHGAFAVPVRACEQEQVTDKPDVIFVCVKGYSLEGTLPTLKRLSDGHTIVIPLLNIYGTGARLQPELSPALVTDGCIYIAAEIKAPGTVHMSGDIFRVVFGPRTPEEYRPELEEAAYIDGAGFFRTFWTINVPLAKSALTTAGILMFLGNWNEYYFASLLTVSDSQRTLPIALAFFTSEFSYNYTQLFAALAIVILPGVILYALAQEKVQASVAATGIKG